MRGLAVADAEDATQSFFEQLLRREVFEKMNTEVRGKMRSFLLTGMQNWLMKNYRWRSAEKRGRAIAPLPLDDGRALQVEGGETPETLFDRQWAETLLLAARQQLEEDYSKAGKQEVFRHLAPYLAGDDAEMTMADLSAAMGVTAGHARVLLHRLRKHYRAALREEIGRTVEKEEDIEEEMLHLRRIFLG